MDERSLNKVFEQIIELYNNEFSKKSKPRNNEGTVLASIFLHHKIFKDIKVVALTTGIKCQNVNEMKRENKDGKILHDSHAEVLAFRAFNRFILQLMHDYEAVDDDDILIKKNGSNFEWNDVWEIGLYVSELPCGDLAVIHEQHKKTITEHQVWKDHEMKQYVDETIKTILRGKNNVKKTGYVRTKPGRFDSVATLSKSCTDKIIMKQKLGLSSGLVSLLLDSELKIKFLILPHVKSTVEENINEKLVKSFKDRIGDDSIRIHFIDRYFGDNINDYSDAKNETKKTSNELGIMLLNKDKYINEPLQDGVRLGYKSKKNSPTLRKNCESIISRHSMFKLYLSLNIDNGLDYNQTKLLNSQRENLKQTVRKQMSTDGWISNIEDNFSI
ncbi:hypothetical protein FOG50_02850 [Hanseniaspora uvarum]|nr:hypothetical protein FOG50_02850 [Hanseniaspora uvarum]